ncbi:hypothetical protein ABZ137_39800 [Streptomyces bobili]|uniref:hypothetical protein n=1 Tax=Streptomyces bobili TaxID=67280 RepID=UPI0033A6945F
MSSPTSASLLTRPADTGSPVLPLSLPHPVTALVTNRPDDLAVVDTAVRLAAPHKAPVLLVAVLPAPSQIPEGARVDAQAARVLLARVLPGSATSPSPAAPRPTAADRCGCGPQARCSRWPPATTPRWWWPPAGDRQAWTRTA